MGSVGLSVERAKQIVVGPATIPLPRIRVGRRADLDALYELELRIFGVDASSRRSIEHSLVSPYQIVLVAEVDGRLIGASIVHCIGSTARHYSIAIVPEWQGRGMGGLLLNKGERWARSRKATTARLEVRDDNERAIAFYRACGYTAFARRIGYYKDGTDALRFIKVL